MPDPTDALLWPESCPEWLTDWPRILDDDPWPALTFPPRGLVVHSGARGRGVAEYAVNEPDGRDIAYHFCHHAESDRLVQCVSLRRRAGHAGRHGNIWWGIALPGPVTQDPRPARQREQLQELVHALVAISRLNHVRRADGSVVPAPLLYWARHSDFSTHCDPGPGFKNEWMRSTGLIWQPPTVR
jgi:N-acetyl-anhydromuramyl-L-alanine amidase AmpD